MAEIVERDKKIMGGARFRTEHMLAWAGSGDAYFDFEMIDAAFQSSRAPMPLCQTFARHAHASH